MISIKDCLDYSDLTEDEVGVIAAHEQLPYPCAVELACSLAQSLEGEEILRGLLQNAVDAASSNAQSEALEAAMVAYRQFTANHPEHWVG